ncbi:uncharacterized protein J3R85_013528 [Psidium guajava]|nr:uncharacterized protein J3R85_013528 [Psidium guajava]
MTSPPAENRALHMETRSYLDLRFPALVLRFLGCFPKAPQNPQADTFGDGGSIAWDTFPVRYPRPSAPLPDPLRFSVSMEGGAPALDGVDDGLVLLGSSPRAAFSLSIKLIFSPQLGLYESVVPHHPEEPCLLNETSDLCNPAITSLSLSLSLDLLIVSTFL